MNENLPTNVQLDANGNGSVVFATDVIATIAGLAATEVEGVASMAGTAGSSSLADIFTRKNQSSKSLTRGVRVDLGENNAVTIHLTIVVDYGSPIPEVAGNIQENVKKAIETMSGLTVSSVDVHVQGVSFEREQRAAKELDEQQKKLLEQSEESAKEEISAEAQPEEPAEEAAPEADEIEDDEEPEDDDVLLDDESEEPEVDAEVLEEAAEENK